MQGCVRGQHDRGQGQGQGHKIVSSRCPRDRGQSSRTPIPGLFFTARHYAEGGYAKSSVCPSLSNSTPYCRLLCACVWSIVFMVLSPLLINHTQKFNVLRPDLEAKVKAVHRRGQGQGQGHTILSSRCPRGRGQSWRYYSVVGGLGYALCTQSIRALNSWAKNKAWDISWSWEVTSSHWRTQVNCSMSRNSKGSVSKRWTTCCWHHKSG